MQPKVHKPLATFMKLSKLFTVCSNPWVLHLSADNENLVSLPSPFMSASIVIIVQFWRNYYFKCDCTIMESNTIIIIHRAHMRTAQHKLKVHALRVIMEVHTSTMEQIGLHYNRGWPTSLMKPLWSNLGACTWVATMYRLRN